MLLLLLVTQLVTGLTEGTLSFPVFVSGSDPLILEFEEEDLSSPARLGSLCHRFVLDHSSLLGVKDHFSGKGDVRTMAIKICQALAEQNNAYYDHSTSFYDGDDMQPLVELEDVLAFLKNGWTVLTGILPELKDDHILRNINETLRLRKFEYVSDALHKARSKWNIDINESRDRCGDFTEDLLNGENLMNPDSAEYVYKYGLAFVICTMNYNIVKRPNEFLYVPFNQMINVHRINSVLYDLATSRRLGQIAAELLRHNTVRLYQTALFSKDGAGLNLQTEWHRDLNMAPIDTHSGGSLTFWCPVYRGMKQELGDSVLRFLSGSHRDMSQRFWYHGLENISTRYDGFEQAKALDVGDCTVHHGWVVHYAPPQPKASHWKDRLAIGFTYVAGDSTVLPDPYRRSNPHRRCRFGDEDEYSYRDWIKDLHEGDVIDHPLLPLVFNSKVF